MNEALVDSAARGGAERPSRGSALFRVALEFTLVFAVTMVARELVAGTVNASYPDLLWLPVIVLTLQHGLAVGLAAAIAAAGLHYSGGLPPAFMSEDMYAYIARAAAEPVGWTCLALLLGHIRSGQIAASAELQAQLAERSRHCDAVADLCVGLRRRIDVLERHIAAEAHSSNVDLAEAMSKLQRAGWDDFVACLTRFVVLMTGAPEFTVHLLDAVYLNLAVQPVDDHRLAANTTIAPDDPIFAAVMQGRRVLSARRHEDNALLAGRGIMAGPLTAGKAPDDVIGMFAIGGISIDDCPSDIERRFLLTSSELSRIAGRIRLAQTWDNAGTSKSNGHAIGASQINETVPGSSKENVSAPPQVAHNHHVTLQ